MNGGQACRTIEDQGGASFPAGFHGLCAERGPSSAPPSSGRSEVATQAYQDRLADAEATPTSFAGARPHWCVDADAAMLTMTTFELWEALERGHVVAWMRVWREGMECWTPVGEIPEFAWAMAKTPAPPRAPEEALPPPEPPPQAATAPPPQRRSGARWIALGSAVAVAAVASALFVSRRSPPAPEEAERSSASEDRGVSGGKRPLTVPDEPAGAAPSVEGVSLALPQEPPAEEAPAHHERGQRRLPRGGRRAYGR